jgi:2',3'-cyclic-nucleotide 2'-phosphodiesterase (5'-nucleotidase family)
MSAYFKNLILALAVLALGACSTKYTLVKTNREEYNINSKIAADSSVIKSYLPYKTQLDAEMNQVIGYTEVALSKQNVGYESVLGNFFADAAFKQAKKINSNIDFAMPSTKGGLRNDFAKGEITVSNIFELMPFENQLIVFTLKGEDVLKLLNYIVASEGQPVAGIKMEVKDKAPVNVIINGKAFDVNQTYQVLTSDYIASGGDDAVGFAKPIAKQVLGLKIRDALLNEVKELQAQGKKVKATLDGRITKNN